MGQAQINVRTRACSRTSIARTKQAALTHNVRGKELKRKLNASLLDLKGRANQVIYTTKIVEFVCPPNISETYFLYDLKGQASVKNHVVHKHGPEDNSSFPTQILKLYTRTK